MKNYSKVALKTMKKTGTITPSSKYLANTMLKNIDFSKDLILVELGIGNGIFTKEILARMNANSILVGIEINDDFYEHCKTLFKNDDRFKLIKASAFDLEQIMQELQIEKTDFVISGLPLGLFPKDKIFGLFEHIKNILTENGKYVQFQYSLIDYRKLKKNFKTVSLDFTIRNFPPAIVYTCSV